MVMTMRTLPAAAMSGDTLSTGLNAGEAMYSEVGIAGIVLVTGSLNGGQTPVS